MTDLTLKTPDQMAEDAHRLLKFSDPQLTAKGEQRAHVALQKLETLWFNTGTLCNIECVNCYILSSPTNDRLVYLSTADVLGYLDEIAANTLGTEEIGFTGGEPFMNPDMLPILDETLARGFRVLMLTNAMAPMMRPKVKAGLLALKERYGDQLTMRVSLDHYSADLHDQERGTGSFAKAMVGLRWLSAHGFSLDIAGRTCWHEAEDEARAGYKELFATEELNLDADNATDLVLFPEMDDTQDVPEITTACWGILDVEPSSVMCATSRMVVKRKGAGHASVAACTLLPYDDRFDLGASLEEAAEPISLNHAHCARFCVLGGGSCSG